MIRILFFAFWLVILPACSWLSNYSDKQTPVIKSLVIHQEFSWPLCGRLHYQSLDSSADWPPEKGCPESRWQKNTTDFPLSSSYGPRLKASEDFRYDFHRGIDIPTRMNTPVFAVNGGIITRAGFHPRFEDPGITIKHYQEQRINCDKSDCLHSLYMHLNKIVVKKGDYVRKGDLIGYSGKPRNGKSHLHFEIRKSPGQQDPLSAWQRDAVHPLRYLSLPTPPSNDDYKIEISDLLVSNSDNLSLKVKVISKDNTKLAFTRLELEIYQQHSDGRLTKIDQKGDRATGETPDGKGYYVNPSWYDLEQINRQFSYKDSNKFPWKSFAKGGLYQSPYAKKLPKSYTAHAHLDWPLKWNKQIGVFDGKAISPSKFSKRTKNYQLKVFYLQLTSPIKAENLCIKARAIDAKGNATEWYRYQCG